MILYEKQVTHKVIIHRSKIGGYWAEVPSMPGCFSQAETLPEMRRMIDDAINEWKPGLLTIPQLPDDALIKPGLVRAIFRFCGIKSSDQSSLQIKSSALTAAGARSATSA